MATISGVDVSSYQGEPAAWRDEAGDIKFAAVKLTELQPDGTRYVNADAAGDWAWLKATGKGRIAYLFGHPSVSAAGTASFFAAQLTRLGYDDSDAVAIDLEVTNDRTAAEVSAWASDVAADLARVLHRVPLLYTYRSFAEAGNCAGLGGLPLWISDPSSPAGRPEVPAPWRTWALHQYEITGDIDRDVADYPSAAAMGSALGKKTGSATIILEDPVLLPVGANSDTPIALPDGASSVRLASIGATTVNIQFAGAHVQQGIELVWDHARVFDVPEGSHTLRVFRPEDGNPNVPVSLAIS